MVVKEPLILNTIAKFMVRGEFLKYGIRKITKMLSEAVSFDVRMERET